MAADTLPLETIILGKAGTGKWCGYAAVYEPCGGQIIRPKKLAKICKFRIVKWILKMKRHHISSFLAIISLVNSLRLRSNILGRKFK